MTREEEMWQTVEEEHGPLLPRESFIMLTAMEWADKTMIENAWDWFYNMALDYMSGDITNVKWGLMKEDFFKAMEE